MLVRETRTLGWGHAALCALALALFIYSGSLANGQVYSFVAGYFGWSREIATLCGALAFLVIGVAARTAPSLLDVRGITTLTVVLMLIQPPVFAVAAGSADPFLTTVALGLRTVSRGWAFACFMLSLTRLARMRMVACAVVIGLFSGRALGSLGLLRAPAALGLDCVGFMFIIAGLTVVPLIYSAVMAFPVFETLRTRESAAVLELTNPNSFLGASHGLFQCVFLFSTAGGFALAFNEVDNAPIALNVAAIVLVAVGLLALLGRKSRQEDALFSFCVMLVMAGFLLVPLDLETAQSAPNTLINLGEDCFDVLVYLVAFSIGQRNLFAVLPVYCFARFAGQMGTIVGAMVGHASDAVVFGQVHTAQAFAPLFVFAFFGFLWVCFRNFSFTNVIFGIECVEASQAAPLVATNGEGDASHAAGIDVQTGPEGAPSVSGDGDMRAPNPIEWIDECCERVGKQCGLTPREREIFAMLAKGRNGRFIMEHYVISRNTVKSHIKHIYAKLDVHSQQELIDMVEGEMGAD